MILKLHVEKEYAPAWYRDRLPAHLPVPETPTGPLRGDPVVWGESEGGRVPLLNVNQGEALFQYDWEVFRPYVLFERYRKLARPLYTRLPFHYHKVPAPIRYAASILQTRGRGARERGFPGFPIEQGFELLCSIYGRLTGSAVPDSGEGPSVYLTHDIENEGTYAWMPRVVEIEKKYGFVSVWHVVPFLYPVDDSSLAGLIHVGCAIGLHGYDHSNRLVFQSEPEQRRRLDRCRGLIEKYGIRSFRSPSWYRTETFYNVLKDYIRVDFSALDSDIICPGGPGGCLWTKAFERNGLRHIPTTIPFELPVQFGCAVRDLPAFWSKKIDWLCAVRGNVVVDTHPDPYYSGTKEMMDVYEEFIASLANLKGKGWGVKLPA